MLGGYITNAFELAELAADRVFFPSLLDQFIVLNLLKSRL